MSRPCLCSWRLVWFRSSSRCCLLVQVIETQGPLLPLPGEGGGDTALFCLVRVSGGFISYMLPQEFLFFKPRIKNGGGE